METRAENVIDVVIHDNDIDSCIYDVCKEHNIDPKSCKQGEWKYVLRLVGQRLFRGTDILKDKSINNIQGNKVAPSNDNRYDYKKVNDLCDYYIAISNKYNKLVSIIAFSYLSDIEESTLHAWREASGTRSEIVKKLTEGRQDSLKDKLFDSSNPVGAMSIGNTEFAWNLPGVRNSLETRQKTPDLPGMERKYLEDSQEKPSEIPLPKQEF